MSKNQPGVVNCVLTIASSDGQDAHVAAKFDRNTGRIFATDQDLHGGDRALDATVSFEGDDTAYPVNEDNGCFTITNNLYATRALQVTQYEILRDGNAHYTGFASREFLDYLLANSAMNILDAPVLVCDTKRIAKARDMASAIHTISNAIEVMALADALGAYLEDTDYQTPEIWLEAILDSEGDPNDEILGIVVQDSHSHLSPASLHEEICALRDEARQSLLQSRKLTLPSGTPDGAGGFDSLQTEILNQYEGGEFLHLQDDSQLDGCGDGLLAFVLREVADAQGDRDEAIRMLESARRQLDGVIASLENAPTPSPK